MYKRQSKKRDNYYGLVTDLYFKKGMSVRAISKKTLHSRITIQRWICLYAEENGIDMAPEKPKGQIKNQAVAKTSEPIPEGNEKRLCAEIRRLELELKRKKLRAGLNEEIINVAEQKFNIQIRKKAGAKR